MKEIILDSPWKHVILENVFSQEDFTKILREVVPMCATYPDGEHVLNLYDAEESGSISREVSDILVNIADSVLVKNAKTLFEQFDGVVESDNGYFCIPQFGITKNFSHGVHCDEVYKSYKTLTFLVYLSPNDSTGTLIYSGEDDRTYHSTVPWKPNSGLYFCPYPDSTWHAFKSDGEVRVTLLLNLKRLDALLDDKVALEKAKQHLPFMVKWLARYAEQGKLFNTSIDLKKLLPE